MPTAKSCNRVGVVILIFGFAVTSARAATNNWIGGTGKWENPARWSLSDVPSITHSAEWITNAANKTVTVDATTISTTPTSMTISNLYVSGAGNTTNILFLNNAGTNTPLLVLNNLTIAAGAVLRMTNSYLRAGGASVDNNAVLEFSLGTNSTPVAVSNNLTLGGKLNVGNSGGFTNTTYTLFTYGGALVDNGLTIGTTPNPGFTYQIVTTNAGQVNLVVGGNTNSPPPSLPFQVTSIVRQGNDVVIAWNTGGISNIVQVSTGNGGSGNYSNNYVDLSGSIIITTPTTNYLDVGGATNLPSRFYRIRSAP